MIDNFYSQIQITYKHVKMYQESFYFQTKIYFQKKKLYFYFFMFYIFSFCFFPFIFSKTNLYQLRLTFIYYTKYNLYEYMYM